MAAGLGAAALIQLCLQECRRLDRGPAAVVHWLQDGEENHVDATCLLTEATVILKTKHRFRWYEYRVVLSPSFRPAWFITEGTMGSQEFLVLYTHQKTKKSKVWQDGVLKISPLGSKAILCDDKGQCLESLFLKCLEVKPGDELESDRYLITIEEVQVVGSTAPKQKAVPEAPASAPGRLTSCGRSLGCQPAGLKRKPTGFQGPRQVAKKVTVIESVKLIPSLETGRSGPASLSPLCSMSALFATTGDRDAQSMPACPEVSVAYKNTERSGMPFPSVVSHPRFKTSPETLREDGDCPRPVSTVSPHSDSLSSNKATTKDFLASRGLGVTQSIRSKAQIVALLKSKPVGMCKELNSRIPEVFPQIYPQASLNIPAESELSGEWGEQTEAKSTESPRSHQPGSGMGARSRWAAYLPSRRSPVDDFTESGGDAESRPQAREGDTVAFKLEGAWGEKRAQLFETCTQEGSRYIGGMPECKIDHSEVQEVEIPSFRGANDLPIVYSSEESNSLLAEPDIQGKTEIPTHQNVQMCVTESVLTREDAQGPVSGTPEKEHQQPGLCPPEPAPLQTESPLSSSQVSDDIVGVLSKSCTGIEDQESAPEPGDSGAQPLVEVTFDLNMFETSDTEESQESGEASQGSEGGPGASWAIGGNAGVHRRGEDMICEEVGRGCEPLLPSVGDKPAEPLLSQFCDDIYAGFDTGPRKARAASGDTEEEHREKRNHLDSSSEWPEDAYAENQEEALGRSTPKDAADADSTPLPSTSARLDAGLQHRPHYLNTPPHQTPENDPLSEQTQPQPFILGNRLGKNEQIFPWTSSHEDGIQLLSPRQCTALDQSHAPVSSSLFYPLEGRHPLSKHTEALTPEPGDRERTRSLPQDHLEVESSGDKQSSSSPRRSPEHSGWENSISLLKSLSEPTTALEGLEIMKRKKNAFQQQQIVQTYKPESGPQDEKALALEATLTNFRPQGWRENSLARKPLTTVLPEAVPQSQLSQESQEMVKENEAESRGPHPSLQVFLGSEGRPAFWTEIPKQVARKPCDPQLVDFHGHRVKGSASSAVMTRQPHFPLEGCQLPRGVGGEDCSSEMCFLSSQMPGTSPVTNFLQFPDKENFPRGDTTFQIEDNFQAVSKSDTHSVENNLIRESSCLVNQNPQRLLLANPPRRPLVTLPPAEGPLAEGPADIAPCSHSMACDFEFQAASAAPTLGLCEEPAPLVFSTRPEHPCEEPFSQESRGAALADVSRLHRSSTGSKWLKYQSATPGSLTAVDRLGGVGAPGSQPGEWPCIPGHRQGEAANRSLPDSVPLQLIRDKLGHQQQACGSPDPIPRRKFPKVLEQSTGARGLQEVNGAALCFPSGQDIQSVCLPQRQVHIPAEFRSPEHYKQVFTSCLIEHLNILLFELAQRLHRALARVDISFYTSAKERPGTGEHTGPSCHHQQPAKLVAVRKEGPNKGRLFYTCDAPKADRCQFFKWLEAVTPGPSMQGQSLPSRVLSDIKSIGLYLRSQKIPVYEECQLLIRKGFDIQRKQYSKLKKFAAANPDFYNEPKSRLYLKLSRKESSSIYSKDDLWVVSKTLDFELDTFIACSAFFGPSSANEVEIVPLRGYFPSNWPLNTVVHALLVCNASTELTTLKNIQDHFSPATLPITQHLLTMTSSAVSNTRTEKRRFIPPASSKLNRKYELLSLEPTLQLARDFIQAHRLNEDQARALGQVAHMMASHSSANEMQRPLAPPLPITIIHGVFGAGKSYLLAVVILFFVQLFEKSETPTAENARPWKLLISSSTNVAVDRVLLGLLSLGFEKFIRVGSVRKIARPVLPYSLHAGSENETEQLRELHALMKEDLTPVERECVRRSIEQHRRGTNRALLQQVRVVGVTCAACSFPCLNELRFPVVVLDECSQITEPAALLPIARFECEKLVLVGDPKQLPPTIQGSDAAHQSGLEQTLFDRLCLMGHQPVLLRTQYRCHPAISALANDLFYEGSLLDGVRAAERGPLLSWLPTLCFYNVKGLEQIERDNSFHNVAEAAFTLKLIRSLLASGVSGAVIGVITLYKSQMYKLCHLLAGAATELPDTKAVQVSTVDAFQGAEKEVVILSCVRTRQVGFIDSEKRMNVALTRGRRHLLIVGSLACLQKNRLWARVIQHCAGREDGLQHASQCEPQLDHVLRAYCEKQAEEKKKKKKDTVS